MAVGDVIKNPLEMLSKAGMAIDADGNVAPLRALIGIDEDTGLPVVVTIKDGKIQCDTELTITGEGLATQTTLAAILMKLIAAPATEANQGTGNSSLSSIDGKLSDIATMQDDIASIKADLAAIRTILES
jgi:hypothetical protein